jgi:alginate O-acetyltransferase complex protein AlgI
MLFNSFEFLILLAATLLFYYLPLPVKWTRPWQVGVLLLASAVFYGWENPKLLVLLGISCGMNSLAVERIIFWKNHPELRRSQRWLTAAVIFNLLFLAAFKYAGILCGILPQSWVSPAATAWILAIPLPIGISFYTFHALSLLIDVHRCKVTEKTQQRLSGRGLGRAASLSDLSLYIVFFPQLVAGPIVKAHQFIDQIRSKLWQEIDWQKVRRCLVMGYFLKIFVADNLAEQTALLGIGKAALAASGPIQLMALLYSYGFQIFADFAGYSLIAIGLGLMFGYRLPENFNFPYLSLSITEFWRRWHLSLSAWLRDYLYIPLGGNRKGTTRTYVNLFLVMFLGGLWHGAMWKFALWGTLHGGLLAAERFVFRNRSEDRATPMISLRCLQNSVRWCYAFHAVMFLWLTFMMPDMASIGAFFRALTGGHWSLPGQSLFALFFYGGIVVLYHFWGFLKEVHPVLASRWTRPSYEGALHGMMIFLILTNPGAPRGFIYFQF